MGMFGLKLDNSRVYRGLESETPEELRVRLRRIKERIRENREMIEKCQTNELLHSIIPQYRSEILGHLRARNRIKGILLDRKA